MRRIAPWHHVTLRELIDAGYLRPPVELRRAFNGQVLIARVETDGRVHAAGHASESLSLAATLAVERAGGRQIRRNGWLFWHFRDSDGELRPLAVLRERLHREGVSR